MKFLVTALPLFSKDMAVEAYRMYYQQANRLFGLAYNYAQLDGAMRSPELDLLNKIGLKPFTGGRPILIGMSKFMLMSEVENTCRIKPESVVWVLHPDICGDESFFGRCVELKAKGFRLAIENVPYTPKYQKIYRVTDLNIVDSTNESRLAEINLLRYNAPSIRFVIKNIASVKRFDLLKNIPDALFEGSFYKEPLSKGVTDMSPVKMNLMRLMALVNNEDFDLLDVAQIVSQDPSMSISLMRFINSPRSGVGTKLTSIQSAVAYLGQREVRKWLTAVIYTKLASDMPNEIVKLALVRARFAENLAKHFKLAERPQALFLTGLFSLLNVVMNMPMQRAVADLPLADDIVNALVSASGPFAPVLDAVRFYERGDWDSMSVVFLRNESTPEAAGEAFMDALLWYRDLLNIFSGAVA